MRKLAKNVNSLSKFISGYKTLLTSLKLLSVSVCVCVRVCVCVSVCVCVCV